MQRSSFLDAKKYNQAPYVQAATVNLQFIRLFDSFSFVSFGSKMKTQCKKNKRISKT